MQTENKLRQLPVGPVVSHMVKSTINNLGFIVRAQWPWMLIVGAIVMAALRSFPEVAGATPEQSEAFLRENPGALLQFFLFVLVAFIVGLIAFASIAVAWHRYILLDEVPQGLAKLRVDRNVWRYFRNLILITLLVIPVMIPLLFLMAVFQSISPFAAIAVAAVYMVVVVSPILYRVSIKLPAIALGRQDFGMGDAWNTSAGNWWQIGAVAIVVTVLSAVASLVLEAVSKLIYSVLGQSLGPWIDLPIQVAINWIITVMGITLLTSLYGFFVEERDF
jgi:hypothetical protein